LASREKTYGEKSSNNQPTTNESPSKPTAFNELVGIFCPFSEAFCLDVKSLVFDLACSTLDPGQVVLFCGIFFLTPKLAGNDPI